MGTLDLFLDAPAIPGVLRLLKEKVGGDRLTSVIESLPDRAHVEKAIAALRTQGIIEEQDGLLKIAGGEEIARRVEGIIRFYAEVDGIARRRLLFRGILNSAQYACLIHLDTLFGLMEAEGNTAQVTEGLIEKDASLGYVERLKIMYRAREGLPHKSFPFIPFHYYPHFVAMKSDNTEHLRARLEHAGIVMIEEEYLLGRYPKQIAAQAREYVEREKEYIRNRIKDEAFDIWWYYRF